jgi:thiol:disulfide interchange protein DsbD
MKLFPLGFGQSGMHLVLTLVLATAPLLAAADDDHVKVSLLSEHDAVVPGTTAWIGVRFEHEPHWHTYWVNPGDSGLPTKLNWQLPPDFHASEIAWPAPQRITVGDLSNFGYEGSVLLPVPIDVPAGAQSGTTAHIGVEVKYLVCREECIPGKANLAIELPIAAPGEQRSLLLFDAARAAQPQATAWKADARLRGETIEVMVHGADVPETLDAFVVQRKLVDYAPPHVAKNRDDVTLSFAKSDYFNTAPQRIDLVVRTATGAWSISAPFAASSTRP